jgi:hypothetical protein
MHHFGRFEESALKPHPTFEGHSEGYRYVSLVDHATGSVHTGLSMNELASGGSIHPHVSGRHHQRIELPSRAG